MPSVTRGRASLGKLWEHQALHLQLENLDTLLPFIGAQSRLGPGQSLLCDHRRTLFSQLVSRRPTRARTPGIPQPNVVAQHL